jgi:nucleoside phosphorylase
VKFCSLRPVSRETLIRQKLGLERLNIDVHAALLIPDFLPLSLCTTMDSRGRRLSHNDYTVACICPMGVELAAVEGMLDEIHESLPSSRDQNGYTLGRIRTHNIVVAVMPAVGNNRAASVATQLLNDFQSIRFGLLVGVGSGVPGKDDNDIRLGDVVVSKPTATFGGVVQYDMGKTTVGGVLQRTGTLKPPPTILMANVQRLQAQQIRSGSQIPRHLMAMLEKYPNMRKKQYVYQGEEHDRLFEATYTHEGGTTCRNCDWTKEVERPSRYDTDPEIHYGAIGSGNAVIRDGATRERLRKDLGVLCMEMEAAGLMDEFSCLVIRGICDYADSHKNERWQPYAAATAAAYMKELLDVIPAQEIAKASKAADALQKTSPSQNFNFVFSFQGVPVVNKAADALQKTSPSQNFNVAFSLQGVPVVNKFVARDSEIAQIEKGLLLDTKHERRRIFALYGLGGIGKTQLALEFARKHQKKYSAVFWVSGKTQLSLKLGLAAIANQLPQEGVAQCLPRIPQGDDKLDVVVREILDWFNLVGNDNWLLIFDNVDWPGEEYGEIKSFIPGADHGSIIITTRQLLLHRFANRSINVTKVNLDQGLRILASNLGKSAEGMLSFLG